MLKKYLLNFIVGILVILLNACNGGGGGLFVNPTPGPNPTTSPNPIIESGNLYFNMSSITLAMGQQANLQIKLSGSQNISSLPVAILSSTPTAATISPDTCYLSNESNTCNISVYAIESGVSIISAIATNYSSPTSIVTVSNQQPSSGLNFNLSEIALNAGESTLVTLSLNNSSQVQPIYVVLTHNPTGIISTSPESCSLSATNSSCNIVITAHQVAGTATLTAAASGYNATSMSTNVTLPLVGWTNTNVIPPVVNGIANNIGFATDQLGNIYLSYQGESTFSVYKYLFNQTAYQWKLIGSTSNQRQQSLASIASSLAIGDSNDIYLAYLTQPTTSDPVNVSYFHALPNAIDFTAAYKITHKYPYEYQGTASPKPACPDARVFIDTAAIATMTLDSGNNQVMAYSDTTAVDDVEVPAESGICYSAGYNGAGRLTVVTMHDSIGVFEQRGIISASSVSQIQIAATPSYNSKLYNYPIFVAYKDNAYGGVTVQRQDNSGMNYAVVGVPGFTSQVRFVSLAVDTNATPYVAYESSNNLLAVKKYSGGTWVDVGNSDITTGNTTWVSIAVSPSDNVPYVAYQEGAKIKVRKFDQASNTWLALGGDLANISNNPAAYTALIMRPNDPDNASAPWQPAITYQATPPSASSSTLSVYYYAN